MISSNKTEDTVSSWVEYIEKLIRWTQIVNLTQNKFNNSNLRTQNIIFV